MSKTYDRAKLQRLASSGGFSVWRYTTNLETHSVLAMGYFEGADIATGDLIIVSGQDKWCSTSPTSTKLFAMSEAWLSEV